MKKQRIIAMLLAACLLLTLAPGALAAPARDTKRAEITVDSGLTALVELALGAAVLRDVPALAPDEAPSQALVEGVLTLGLYQTSLAYADEDIWDDQASLKTEDLEELYKTVFTNGAYALPEKSTCPCITLKPDGLDFDLSSLAGNPLIGAHIYSTAFDGTDATVLCDLFTYYGPAAQNAETLPEDALTWLCNAEISLRRAPDAPYGYTLNGYSLSDTYLNGMLYDWHTVENTEFEYSVTLPSILGLAEDQPQAMTWQTAEGDATLTIRVHAEEGQTYDRILSDYTKQNPDQTVTEEQDFSLFYGVGEGAYGLWIVPAELPWAYELTFEFPAQRQAEFTLYAEFIRNSLIVWGVSNG